MNLNANTRIRPVENVFAREFDGEVVLLDLQGGVYYGLDPLASQVWNEMCAGKTIGDVVARLVGEYEVTERVALDDVISLATEWVDKKLVEQVSS